MHRGGDLEGIVGIIVDDGGAFPFPDLGETAAHALEFRQRLADHGFADSQLTRHHNRRHGVLYIVFAGHGQLQAVPAYFTVLAAVSEDDIEMRDAFGETHIHRPGIGLGRKTVGDQAAVGDAAHHGLDFGMVEA